MRSRHGPTVVVGLGTRLMGDDAIGLALLDHLREQFDLTGDVLTLDGEAWTTHLTPLVRSARPEVEQGVWPAPGATLVEIEREAILRTLDRCGGSAARAAELLGVSVRKIQYRMRKYRSGGPLRRAEDGHRPLPPRLV